MIAALAARDGAALRDLLVRHLRTKLQAVLETMDGQDERVVREEVDMTYRTSPRRALQLGLAASLAAPAIAARQRGCARPQGWPSGPITWLNPFPAGGGTDVFARPLAAQVGDQLGVQILIDNKGGAGGTVGASQAAKMKPDG